MNADTYFKVNDNVTGKIKKNMGKVGVVTGVIIEGKNKRKYHVRFENEETILTGCGGIRHTNGIPDRILVVDDPQDYVDAFDPTAVVNNADNIDIDIVNAYANGNDNDNADNNVDGNIGNVEENANNAAANNNENDENIELMEENESDHDPNEANEPDNDEYVHI